MVQVECSDDPECGAPKILHQQTEVGVHKANLVMPREQVIGDAMTHVQENAVHSWGRK